MMIVEHTPLHPFLVLLDTVKIRVVLPTIEIMPMVVIITGDVSRMGRFVTNIRLMILCV